MIKSITVTNDVTLISLEDSPADINLIADIFDMIAKAHIDVDMISQTPVHSNAQNLSFTVSDDDLGKILETSACLRKLNPDLKLSVSSGNCKISLFSEDMRGCPGIAVKVFKAASQVNADIRMITTSEVDISILVSKADFEDTLSKINEIFE
ncbi:MAG: hypothetical protein RR552_01820 [Oscillospiraceae bacterium]